MSKTKILIVEDEAITAINMKMELNSKGYEVCGFVVTGEDAIKNVEQEEPDIVLMDIRIKGEIDGIEAARRIRTGYDIPIIFTTGFDDEETRKQAMAIEYTEYLIKPVEIEDLISAIEKALQAYE